MKKIFGFLMVLTLLFSVCAISAGAETADVYVTIANGEIVLAMEKVTVSDIDGDGALTINDALYAAHEAAFKGGAAAGYASVQGDWGLSLAKLWGVENGGSYGYMVNNVSAWSLADPVATGDHVYAYVYTDTVAFSDTYSFFDINTADFLEGKSVSLTLTASGYDENWAPMLIPVSGAVITLNGEKTQYVTDENGKVEVTIENRGDYIISAVSDSMTLVPPVVTAIVRPALLSSNPSTDDGSVIIFAVSAVTALALAAIFVIKSRRYEK